MIKHTSKGYNSGYFVSIRLLEFIGPFDPEAFDPVEMTLRMGDWLSA